MNKNKASIFIVLAGFITTLILYSCGDGGGGSSSENTTQSQPTAEVNPSSPSLIKADTSIVITFSTSMDTATLSLGGTIMEGSSGGTWSATSASNDTLTIRPTTSWSNGGKSLTVDVNDLSGNALETLSLRYIVDATLPAGSVTPPSGDTITQSASIVVSYTETMDSASLSAGGSMWGESDGGSWSTTTNADDTLTISPAIQWSLDGQTLDISVNDVVGNNSTLNLNYTVVSAIDSDGDGSPSSLDCDDTDDTVYPGAAELCDNKDNDCDASVDEDLVLPSYPNSTTTCSSGTESLICDSGWTDCDGNIVNGCEADLLSDLNHCGACSTSCDDGFSCSSDSCISGSCMNIPNDTVCSDGEYCTGAEICDPNAPDADTFGCIAGTSPSCAGDQCNVGSCDEAGDSCTSTPVADGTACDDGDSNTFNDVCTAGACSGVADPDVDNDGVPASLDCNDNDSTVYPGAVEMCDSTDNDCDEEIDEDFTNLGQSCNTGTGACQATGSYVCSGDGTGTVCDAVAGIPSDEICDGLDNDCDGSVDNNLSAPLCTYQEGVCGGSTQTCGGASGWQACSQDNYGPDYEVYEYTCDNLDNDCDGSVDENIATVDVANCTESTCEAGVYVDTPLSSSTVCRVSSGQCDVSETCDGLNTYCPADTYQPAGTTCDDGDISTTNDQCDGAGLCTGVP